jgi:hypothetical protein
VRARRSSSATYAPAELDALNDVLDAYCIDCHSNDLKLGNLSLDGFDVGHADSAREGREDDQRLNRSEYENVIRGWLGAEINAADYLPLDTKSANLHRIADAQLLSPTFLEAYLNAAATVKTAPR